MAKDPIPEILDRFTAAISKIAHFWGFPKGMGAAYAVIYLSREPMTLDDLVLGVGISKGALSTHMRQLERFGLVEREAKPGDRKDYYRAGTDFWGVVRRLLAEREQREFDRALSTVRLCLARLDEVERDTDHDPELLAFWRERLGSMQRFFDSLDRIVATVLALDNLSHAALDRLLGGCGAAGKKR